MSEPSHSQRPSEAGVEHPQEVPASQRLTHAIDEVVENVRRRPETFFGPIASITFHILFLIAAAYLIIRPAPGPNRPAEEIELAILTEQEMQTAPQMDQEVIAPAIEVVQQEQPKPQEIMLDAELLTQTLARPESGLLETLGASGQESGAADLLGGGGGAAGTSFFGIEARGSRFMYIVDVSGSMSTEDRITILKNELIASISELPPHASFYIIAYSSDPYPMSASRQWARATEAARLEYSAWVRRLNSGGGTEPSTSFDMAFAFKPAPDVIFFMTDGQNISGLSTYVSQLNSRGRRTVINTIAFGDSGSEDMMREIARNSGGKYRFVPSS